MGLGFKQMCSQCGYKKNANPVARNSPLANGIVSGTAAQGSGSVSTIISRRPHSITVHRNNVTSVLLSQYSSEKVHEIFSTSLLLYLRMKKQLIYLGSHERSFPYFSAMYVSVFLREISIVFQGLILRLVVHYHALKILCSQPWGK